MFDGDVLKGMPMEAGGQTVWSPGVKLILFFIIGFLALLPATLGLYWESLLP
jgi:hypothetical protein